MSIYGLHGVVGLAVRLRACHLGPTILGPEAADRKQETWKAEFGATWEFPKIRGPCNPQNNRALITRTPARKDPPIRRSSHFVSILGYFGVCRPLVLSFLAFQEGGA